MRMAILLVVLVVGQRTAYLNWRAIESIRAPSRRQRLWAGHCLRISRTRRSHSYRWCPSRAIRRIFTGVFVNAGCDTLASFARTTGMLSIALQLGLPTWVATNRLSWPAVGNTDPCTLTAIARHGFSTGIPSFRSWRTRCSRSSCGRYTYSRGWCLRHDLWVALGNAISQSGVERARDLGLSTSFPAKRGVGLVIR